MKKRLTRDTKHQLLGGVCAGIAKYFDIDPVLVRVLFIISGIGLFTYFILWLIIPSDIEA